ncbi:MAG: STAS/SEC14 domain-containing protein [Bacteroidia bacterium]
MNNECRQETDKLKFYRKGNVIYGEFKSRVDYDIELAKQAVELRSCISAGERYFLLFDARNLKSITKEARDYLNSDYVTKDMMAAATLVDSAIVKIIVQLFMVLNKPSCPVRYFNQLADAEKWLQEQEVPVLQ